MNILPKASGREPNESSLGYHDSGDRFASAEIQASDEDNFSLSNIILTLWSNKWILLLATAVCAGIAAWDVSRKTPLYTATSQIVLKTAQEQVIDLQGVTPQLSVDYGGINTELRVLRSRELIGRVADAMSLQSEGGLNTLLRSLSYREKASAFDDLRRLIGLAPEPAPAAPAPGQARESAISSLLTKVTVSHVRDSYVFEIRATTADPKLSADIANNIAQVYVDGQRETKFKAMEEAMAWLSGRVVGLKEEVEAAEGKVKKFVASARLMSAEALGTDTLRLKAMRDSRTEQLETAQQLRNQIAQLSGLRARADFAALAQAIDDPVGRRAARDLAEGPADPTSIARFVAVFGALIKGLGADADRAENQASEIESVIAELAANVDIQSSDLIALQQLKREAEAARLIYESFLNRLKEISVQQGIQQSDSRVLSVAGIPGAPSYPLKRQTIVRGGFVGIALGIVLVFIQNALRNTIRTPEELEAITASTVIGVIPDDRVSRPGPLIDQIVSKPSSSLAEAIRNLRTAIQLSNVDETPRVVVVTSSVPDEGKSILASTLATITAMSGKKVLLVDADLRRRILREYFSVTHKAGLVSLLSGRTSFDETVQRDDRTGLDILIADDEKVTPVDLFESKQFGKFITEAREKYDLVVLDTPPVLAVPDARVVCQHADAVVYAVRWSSTSRRMIQSGLALLRQVNIHVTGVALTRVDAMRMDLYGYYGYGYHKNRLQRYYAN